ncbi:hypothetical protein [Nocardia amamiensis]|uniref:hypothetical protein n=1 Tax=Nocardia amamiensis TaxID=404578 RepID=UPI0035A2428F
MNVYQVTIGHRHLLAFHGRPRRYGTDDLVSTGPPLASTRPYRHPQCRPARIVIVPPWVPLTDLAASTARARLRFLAQIGDRDVGSPKHSTSKRCAPQSGRASLPCNAAPTTPNYSTTQRGSTIPALKDKPRPNGPLLHALQGHCNSPIAGYASIDPAGRLSLRGRVFTPDGSQWLDSHHWGVGEEPEALGFFVGADLLRQGARAIMDAIPHELPNAFEQPRDCAQSAKILTAQPDRGSREHRRFSERVHRRRGKSDR